MTPDQQKAIERAWCKYRNMEYVDGHVNPLPSDNFTQGYLAAADTLRNQWISVNDRLPEDGQHILIYTDYIGANSGEPRTLVEQYRYFKDYEGDGFRLKEAIERDIKLKVTHWIPIPPLPKEKVTQSQESES